MSKHKILGVLIVGILINFSTPIFAQNQDVTVKTETEVKKPNIIFILTDDQRWDAIGYAGNELAYTPQMDALAGDGVYFNNAISTTPICSASRASSFTGLFERTHKYSFQTGAIREEYMQEAYPKVLRESGYYTGFYGKFGVNYGGLDKQFDEYESYDRVYAYHSRKGYYYKTIDKDTVHLTRYTGHKAIEFIKNAPEDKPFCLQLSFSAPHAHDTAEEQYFWDEETAFVLENTVIPDANISEDKYYDALPQIVKDGFNRLRWYWRYDTPEKYQHSVKGYYRMIAGIDFEIKRIREELDKKGLAENTVIILMGDNGQFLGERQIAGKWLMYDNSVRVPLIIYDPRANEHRDVEEMALNIDIAATILDFAGVQQPKSWQGESLVPFIKDDDVILKRDTILIEHLWEFENIPPSEGVRTKDWKYLRYVNDKSIEELYDLKKDPTEIHNLVNHKKYQKVLVNLSDKCDELILKYADPYSGIPSELTTELIRKPESVLIKDTTPEFGWVVPKEAVNQTAYQILVASSKENIDDNIGDVWNSTRIYENTSSNVAYNGSELKTGVKYYWKVRIWDNIKRTGVYAEPQTFEIAETGHGLATPNTIHQERIQPETVKKKVMTTL